MVTVTLHPDIRHGWSVAPGLRKTSDTGPDTGLHARLGSGPTTLRELLEVPCWISSRGKRLHSYRHRRRLYSWRHSHRDGVALARYGGETTVRSTGEEVTIHPWATFLETRRLGRWAAAGAAAPAAAPTPALCLAGDADTLSDLDWLVLDIDFKPEGRGDVPFRSGLPGPAPGGGQSRWLPRFQLHFGERRPHPGPPRGVGRRGGPGAEHDAAGGGRPGPDRADRGPVSARGQGPGLRPF